MTLPTSLIRAITLVAADEKTPPQALLKAAVLITVGYGLYVQHAPIDPRQVAIPTRQWNEISQALATVPGLSEIARVNLVLDWVSLGPGRVDPTPDSNDRPR